jgi:hypothetical protein
MTPPKPGDSDGADPGRPQEPIPPSLPTLRNCESRLSDLLEDIDIDPESLDELAPSVHKDLVMGAYKLMRTEVAQTCGSRWDPRDKRRFNDCYHGVANKWPAYRQALHELKVVRDSGRSQVDALVRLEGPRSGYIYWLSSFYDEFSAVLDVFFPSPP